MVVCPACVVGFSGLSQAENVTLVRNNPVITATNLLSPLRSLELEEWWRLSVSSLGSSFT